MSDVCGSGDLTIFDNQTRKAVIKALYSFQSSYMPVHGYVASLICIFGIITNIIHIFVLTRKSMRHSAVNCILTIVGISDLGTMASYLTYLLQFVLPNNKHCTGFTDYYYWMYFAMAHVFNSVYLHTMSIWLITAMAFMRLMALRLPTLSSPWQSAKRARKITAIVAAIVFILSSPILMMHKITSASLPEGFCLKGNKDFTGISNRTVNYYYAHLSMAAVKNGCFLLKTQLAIVGIIFKLFPCVLLAILSSKLISVVHGRRKLRKALRNSRRHMTHGNHHFHFHRPDRITLVLLTILIIFLLTELPQGILTIAGAIFTQEIYFYVYGGMADLLDLLSLLNSSVNFLIYCLMSSEYRNAFWEAILPKRYKRELVQYQSNFTMENNFNIRRIGRKMTNSNQNYTSVAVNNITENIYYL